jgi:hypothetical protein
MLAQTMDRDVHMRGVRSQAAAGSNPQTAFAHAHITKPPLTRARARPARPAHTIARATPLLDDWDGALRAAAVSKEE